MLVVERVAHPTVYSGKLHICGESATGDLRYSGGPLGMAFRLVTRLGVCYRIQRARGHTCDGRPPATPTCLLYVAPLSGTSPLLGNSAQKPQPQALHMINLWSIYARCAHEINTVIMLCRPTATESCLPPSYLTVAACGRDCSIVQLHNSKSMSVTSPLISLHAEGCLIPGVGSKFALLLPKNIFPHHI